MDAPTKRTVEAMQCVIDADGIAIEKWSVMKDSAFREQYKM